MKIESKNNSRIVITDEHSTSSYHIPVILVDGVAYGDADIIEEIGEVGEVEHTVLTGAQCKYDIARREYADNAEMFDWIVKGTGYTHAAFISKRDQERTATSWMFANE